MRAAIIIVGAVAVLLTAPAATGRQSRPAQTIETAVEFLNILAQSGQLHVRADNGDGFGVDRFAAHADIYEFAATPIAKMIVHKSNRCQTNVFTGKFHHSTQREYSNGDRYRFENPHAKLFLLTGAVEEREDPYVYFSKSAGGINWEKIPKVSQSESSVIVTLSSSQALQFVTSTPELAARAAYAMEFIRLECDPTANSAF